MNELVKKKDDLYRETQIQKRRAWEEKDYKKAKRIREIEKENYAKWKFLNGFIKANERIKKDGED